MTLTQKTRLLGLNSPLGEDVLLLTGFTGREEMSRLFSFRLDMLSEKGDLKAKDIVGKNVTFHVKLSDGSPRCFNGFVSRFFAGDEDEKGRRNYRAEVVPWLWFLTQTADCRIFQNKTVPDIIKQVFSDLGFSDFEMKTQGNHKPWDYCVQYRETDFNFVSRLMEQEGIYYYFRHENGKHTLVMSDSKTGYTDCAENEVKYPRILGDLAYQDHITSWEHRYEFRPGKWAQTDYNFETPTTSLMTNTPSLVKMTGMDKYEIYDYPGEYEQKSDGDGETKIRMEEEEAAHDVVYATSLCKTFTPGGKFKIKEHKAKAEQGKSYLITSIQHTASEPLAYETGTSVEQDYTNTFTCIPDSVMFRATRITPKPFVQGVQTAVIVGPKGEEIYTDKYGRVKVQFHWDREGKKDENSSCWIRVSQIHAGKGWGGIDIPRIGEEVIVDFLEGDPDRPIITGRVYNAGSMPPFGLPGEMTRSGLKSNTHKGSGFNEISMDDTAGKEQIRIHGQYNMDARVENDETHSIGMNRTADVGVDEKMSVGNNQSLMVGVNKTVQVGTNHTETVGVNQAVTVGTNQSTNVGTSQSNSVGVSQSNSVGVAKQENVGSLSNQLIGALKNAAIGFVMNEMVGLIKSYIVGSDFSVTAGQSVKISAASSIEIVCGASSIKMDSGGKIVISGSDITVSSSGPATYSSGGVTQINGGGNVDINGPMIDLN